MSNLGRELGRASKELGSELGKVLKESLITNWAKERFRAKMAALGIKKCPKCGEWAYTEERHAGFRVEKRPYGIVWIAETGAVTIEKKCKACGLHEFEVISRRRKYKVFG